MSGRKLRGKHSSFWPDPRGDGAWGRREGGRWRLRRPPREISPAAIVLLRASHQRWARAGTGTPPTPSNGRPNPLLGQPAPPAEHPAGCRCHLLRRRAPPQGRRFVSAAAPRSAAQRPEAGGGPGYPGCPGRDAGHAGDPGSRSGQVAEPPRAERHRAPQPDPTAPRALPAPNPKAPHPTAPGGSQPQRSPRPTHPTPGRAAPAGGAADKAAGRYAAASRRTKGPGAAPPRAARRYAPTGPLRAAPLPAEFTLLSPAPGDSPSGASLLGASNGRRGGRGAVPPGWGSGRGVRALRPRRRGCGFGAPSRPLAFRAVKIGSAGLAGQGIPGD